jgi:glycosyltransferase involved in cell wall biosynthesis
MAEAIEHLAARCDVLLLTLRADDEPAVDERLVRSCRLVEEVRRERVDGSPRRLWVERRRLVLAARRRPGWAVGHSVAALRRRLDEVVHDQAPDVVQLEYLVLADLASAISTPGPPIVLVEHDARPPAITGHGGRWQALRRAAARNVQAIVTFSEEDARVVREDAGATRVLVIPPGLDLPPRAGPGEREDVLFIGGSDHSPNRDAALRLIHQIHPRVRRLHPTATLTLVGNVAPGVVGGEGVQVVGRVEDVMPYVERAAVVVAPLSEGGGVRVKVLDALARGKAVVASPRAVEGIGIRPGEHALVVEEDEATAEAIATVLGDVELRRRIGRAARAWAEANLSWDVALDRYERLYEELTAR